MKTYTEEELEALSSQQLKTIVCELAKFFNCEDLEIAPKGARKELLISSILESQEEAGGELSQGRLF